MKYSLLIPVYNHEQAITVVVEKLKPLGLPCLLVNDGSSDACSRVLRHLLEQQPEWLSLYERQQNGGKGAAVIDGFHQLINQGYSHAIQLDADGQHQLDDVEKFVRYSEQYPEHLILGRPAFDQTVPKRRLYGRQLTNFWIWINTLSFAIADGMCGFRCYPLSAIEQLLASVNLGKGMDFDIEVVVRLYWQGIDIINLPTRVQYPLDGISHFNMLQDNLLISKKHAQLFFGMLFRSPRLLMRHRK